MNKRSRPYWWVKRGIDVAVGAIGLIASAPVIGVVAAVVRTKLGSPVFFRQQRPGLDGRPFELIKFRTMLLPDESRGLVTNEQRMTRVGSLLRSTSLDELPSLWNVVRGDMSLVGPRPLRMSYLSLYDSRQRRRHEVRPGVTGLAQVSGRNAVGWPERLELDVQYVETYSLRVDLQILARTVRSVTRRSGISGDGLAAMSAFTGNAPLGAVTFMPLAEDWLATRVDWLSDSRISDGVSLEFEPNLPDTQRWFKAIAEDQSRRDWVYFDGSPTPVAMAGVTGVGTPDLEMYLYVNPEMQGRGYGRRTLQALLRQSVALGAHRLHLEVKEANTRAIDLYRSAGFLQAPHPSANPSKLSMVADLRTPDAGLETLSCAS